jgi:hypothetical protein
MLDQARRYLNPGSAACIAAVLVAAGFEVNEPLLKHVLEILGGLVAVLGLVFGGRAPAA